MTTGLVLFTRDLRVRDNPALAAAAREHEQLLPLFVLDDHLVTAAGERRQAFLADALHDLSGSLGGLAVRRGETVAETVKLARAVGAHTVHVADDASVFAQRRVRRLSEVIEVRVHPSTSVVPLDALPTTSGGAYRVFTPYWRVWRTFPRRAIEAPPRVTLPDGVDLGVLPDARDSQWRGGEAEGRRRLRRFLVDGLGAYGGDAPELADGASSGLSAYLHFGCLSPLEAAVLGESNDRFVRQLCWRDFFLQLFAAHPSLERDDLHAPRYAVRDDPERLEAWREGATGIAIVDAAMRHLNAEGWLPNRARLIAASYLAKSLRIDWRHGAAHFAEHLVDADVASNAGNWQWVAGTGTDTRPNRMLNPERQAARHDPDGAYVARHSDS
ncbi:MAG TPA: deoxyribodipyrimidine photo-lyase [Gaiellaceae bacterium]|nr:deoxyribodipyrimidine photo-lyase [Gaiellaceae bacterium]